MNRWILLTATALAAALTGGLALLLEDGIGPWAPLVMDVVLCAGFLETLRRTSGGAIRLADGGVVLFGVMAVYSIVPLLGYLSAGGSYLASHDVRLYAMSPGPREVGTIGLYYTLALATFGLTYLACRDPRRESRLNFDAGPGVVAGVLILFLLIRLYQAALTYFFDLSYSSYSESYLVYSRLPMLLGQVTSHLDGVAFILEILLIGYAFSHYRRLKVLIWGWLFLLLFYSLLQLEGRSHLVLFAVVTLLLYDLKVRRVRLGWVGVVLLVTLSAFHVMGALRNLVVSGATWEAADLLVSGSEFDSLFANALDVARIREAGHPLQDPWAVYTSDILALVPQQILGESKFSTSHWYVTTFYPEYARMGGGFAFGLVSESLLGFGAVEIVARCAFLGVVFAGLLRLPRGAAPFLRSCFVLWVTILSYQCFRRTTLALLPLAVLQFLPVAAWVGVLRLFFRDHPRPERLEDPAPEAAVPARGSAAT